jgi:predicted RNase H-like nuclease (RuvC/YqgF family)
MTKTEEIAQLRAQLRKVEEHRDELLDTLGRSQKEVQLLTDGLTEVRAAACHKMMEARAIQNTTEALMRRTDTKDEYYKQLQRGHTAHANHQAAFEKMWFFITSVALHVNTMAKREIINLSQ